METKEIHKLLSQMTTEDKISQLIQLDGSLYRDDAAVTGPEATLGISEEVTDNMGSVYNVIGATELKQIQKEHLTKSRNKIPLLFCADIIYGYKTVLPIPLGFACSWNPELIKGGMQMVARETTASGIHAVFSPVADLARDPRWGRVMESTGEDPYLSSLFAAAQVEGFQGDFNFENVASCLKHFAAYGAPEAGREYNTVDMSERKLRESYLPAYKAAVEAGCKMVMTSFNSLNGIPATGNKWLLRDILRKEWGFNGVTVSDYAAIQELIYHGFAEDETHAATLALEAGVDFDMKTSIYAKHLKSLIDNNDVNRELLDEAVLRILELKNELGLFENPFRGADPKRENQELYSDKNRLIARNIAEESLVLLKNDNQVLPLNPAKKIALIGPYADEKSLNGLWALYAEKDKIVTLKTAMEYEFGENLSYAYGCEIIEDYSLLGEFGLMIQKKEVKRDAKQDLADALAVAREADIIVVTIGEHTLQSGEAASRTDLTINKSQIYLLEKLSKLNKPIVAILFNGRPLVLDNILDKVDGLVEAWFPGTEGALALTDILSGKVNPSGKLTMSFPVNEGQIPIYYNEFKTGRPIVGSGHSGKFVSKYLDVGNEPKFSFGYGLSYTLFDYSEIRLNKHVLTEEDTIKATITVRNSGERKGKETVQLYIQDVSGSVVRPVKELKGFQKIELDPKESKKVVFEISENDLRYFTQDMSYKSEPGLFKLFIGSNSKDVKESEFSFTKS